MLKIGFVPFCLPPDKSGLTQKGTQKRHPQSIYSLPPLAGREGALINISSSVASSSVILFLEQNR